MNSSFSRIFLTPKSHLANAGAGISHPADRGTWIWHPDKPVRETAILRFRLRFHLKEGASPLLHVTADQRFQLRCDGRDVTFGPDRCDLEHWTVHTVRLDLEPGTHELEALVWWIGGTAVEAVSAGPALSGFKPQVTPPMAQVSWCGGFLIYAEETDSSVFNTGSAPWMVEDLTNAASMKMPEIPQYIDVGPLFSFDLERWEQGLAKPAIAVLEPVPENKYGLRRPGRSLFPAEIPEQKRQLWTGGRIRAVRADWNETPYLPQHESGAEIEAWQQLVAHGQPLTVPANSHLTVLWDSETYTSGYPSIRTKGGTGAVLGFGWAEALYEEPRPQDIHYLSSKGNRNEIAGKVFLGLEDKWIVGSQSEGTTPALWWRSGRYLRIRVETGDEPLTVSFLGIVKTGYPVDTGANWSSSDVQWDRLIPFFENSFRNAMHETWTDSPYYEQMCYVPDTALDALSNYALFPDARLSRRAIQMFEWSRRPSGLVAERYPSGWRQEAATLCLLWPGMVRDYAFWRDDAAFVKSMLPGIRSVLAEFDGMACPDGLLHEALGWPFVDWVPEWDSGCGPGLREGDSSIMNLHWVLALVAASEVEQAYGEAVFAERFANLAGRTFDAILNRYWDPQRGLMLDTHGQHFASEHAQALSLISGLLDEQKTASCLTALEKGDGLSKASIYFSFYVLEALYRHGREAEFHRRLGLWRGLPDQGFTSTPESSEPSRSDSHSFSAHPAWHTFASIAGVRPDAAAFSRVRIAPLSGTLDHFDAKVVHPRGLVEVGFLRLHGCQFQFNIVLPESIDGTLVFNDRTYALASGLNKVSGTLSDFSTEIS